MSFLKCVLYTLLQVQLLTISVNKESFLTCQQNIIRYSIVTIDKIV